MLAISTLTGKPFPTVKIAFDVSMVIISLITCLIFLHGLGSVGIGTVIAALLCRYRAAHDYASVRSLAR